MYLSFMWDNQSFYITQINCSRRLAKTNSLLSRGAGCKCSLCLLHYWDSQEESHSIRVRGPQILSDGAFSTGEAFSLLEFESNFNHISTAYTTYWLPFDEDYVWRKWYDHQPSKTTKYTLPMLWKPDEKLKSWGTNFGRKISRFNWGGFRLY